MRVLRKVSFAGAVLSLAGLASAAQAGPAWEFTTVGDSFTTGTWDFATAFTVNSPLTVSGLGYFANAVTGNVDGNPVAFYQCNDAACLTTGALLASANVTNIYPLTGHFRYVTIPEITLVPGTSYEVAGVSSTDNFVFNDIGYFENPAITVLTTSGQAGRWTMLGTPDFLIGSDILDLVGKDGYWGPNVFFGAPSFTGDVPDDVPEPMTLLLFGFGLMGLGAMHRKAKKS